MAHPFTLPEMFKIVDATAGPVTTSGGVTSDYVSLKNVQMAYIVLQFKNAVSDTTTVQPQVATAVAPSGATSITFSADWWLNAATGTNDTFVKQTAATSMDADAGTTAQQMIIRIDPDQVAAQGVTLDVIGFTVGNSSQATDFVSGQFFLLPRYAQATPLTAVTD